VSSDDRVVTTGHQRGHVQNGANDAPAAAGEAFAAHRAAVTIDRSDADQGGDGLSADLAEFGQAGQ